MLEDRRAIEVGEGSTDLSGGSGFVTKHVEDLATCGIRQRFEYRIIAFVLINERSYIFCRRHVVKISHE